MDGLTPLDAALSYAARGWRVIPIKPGKKHPHIDEWQNVATTDESLIRDWWAKWPNYGVGIATGRASGIFVLDVDISNGKLGEEVLADLEHEYGRLPDTVEVITGTGGRHIYFKHPDQLDIRNESACSLGPGLDIRGEGGQVLAPPTVHPNGRRYEWEASSNPDDIEVADAPDWLLDMLTKAPDPTKARRDRTYAKGDDTPGNRFAASTTWPDLLEADGATYLGTRTHRRNGLPYEMWARPGVDHTSATLYFHGSDVLKVFTDCWGGVDTETGEVWQLEQGQTYTKFGYYAARHHSGDMHAAAAALAQQEEAEWLADIAATPKSVPLPESSDEAGDEWGEPYPLRGIVGTPPPFPVEVLPDWMARYCVALADEMQVPVDLCGQIALGAWSAACAGRARIVVAGKWAEHLNLFLAAVMPSGGGKSPVSKRLTAPLRDLEAEMAEQYRRLIAEAKARKRVLEREYAAAEKAGDETRMVAIDLELDDAKVPASPRLVVDDVTPEQLAVLLDRHGGRMAIVSTEATLFDIACGLYSGATKKVNNNVYLQGWSADPLIVDRKGSSSGEGTEIRIPEPVLTVAIAVQPSTIAELAKHPELAGRGFTARFMYAAPPSMLGRRNRSRVLDDGNTQAATTYRDTFLAFARRFITWDHPATMKASPEAQQLFVDWLTAMEPLLNEGGELGDVSEWTAKLQASVARVAGLLHLADGHNVSDLISVDIMQRAIVLGEYWTDHALTIAEVWQDDPTLRLARRIVAERFVEAGVRQFEPSTISREWYRRPVENIAREAGVLPGEVVHDVLLLLAENDYIRTLDGSPIRRPSRGREAQQLVVNPKARAGVRKTLTPARNRYSMRALGEVIGPYVNVPIERDTRFSLSLYPPPASTSSLEARTYEHIKPMCGDDHPTSTSSSPKPSGWLFADPDPEGAA